MMDYLEQNLEHLRRLDQTLADRVEKASLPEGAEIMAAKNGQPTMVLKGITFHSRIDPGAEGLKMAAAALDAATKAGKSPGFFGLGLGWHVLALADLAREVMVAEPDPGMIRLALTRLDFGPRMSNVRWVINPDDLASPDGWVLMPHPPTARLHRDAYRKWTRFFEQVFEAAGETAAALKERLGDLSGTAALLEGLNRDEKLGLEDLVQRVQKREKPLTEIEIYILLLKELQL